MSFFALSQTGVEELKISLAGFVINLGLLVSWINADFKANGGE
ncbi:hypothetical protein [Acinetobacter sp. ANC 5378]|nr:hypothetical protein [Acinetobacter sp. ANC 5378]